MVHKKALIKSYDLDIGHVEIYDYYMLTRLNEGITLNFEKAFDLITITDVHFRNKNFVYITNRVNSYAVDPTIYTEVSQIENLKAIAIISNKQLSRHNVKVERLFFGKPMKLFATLTEAVEWSKLIIG